MNLSEQDFIHAAQELECDRAAIKAVAEVESSGDAFLSNGMPKILFEAHHFSRLTDGKYDNSHPNISSPKWNKKLYRGGIAEHRRLDDAVKLDREAALQSASWGTFQIMGFNWKHCGFKSLQAFINAMYAGPSGQMQAFVGYIKGDKALWKALQKRKWTMFAKLYNGPSYGENKYDLKLEQAYKRVLSEYQA